MKVGSLVQWKSIYPTPMGIVVKIKEFDHNHGANVLVDFNPQRNFRRWFCAKELKVL